MLTAFKKFRSNLRSNYVSRPNAVAFVNNSGWLLFDKLIRMILGVLVGAWVARYLGPSSYGEISYALAYIAIFMALANMGADGITVRDLAINPTGAGEILGTATCVRALVGMTCLCVAIASSALLNNGKPLQIVVVAVIGTTLIIQSLDTIDLWFQSNSQSRRTVTSKLVAYVLSNGIKIVLIFLHAPLLAFAFILMLDALTAACALLLAYRRFPTPDRWRWAKARAIQFWRNALPFMVGGFLIVVYLRIDQIMVKQLMGERALGMYASAIWLLQIWQIIPTTASVSLGPFVARQKKRNEQSYRRTMVIIYRIFFYTGLLGAIMTYFAAPLIVSVFYGKAYADAVPIMQIYSITLPLFFLSLAHNLWLINEGKYRVRIYGAVIASGMTVACILLLYKEIGLLSACVAAIASQYVALHLINAVFDKDAFEMQLRAIIFRQSPAAVIRT